MCVCVRERERGKMTHCSYVCGSKITPVLLSMHEMGISMPRGGGGGILFEGVPPVEGRGGEGRGGGGGGL